MELFRGIIDIIGQIFELFTVQFYFMTFFRNKIKSKKLLWIFGSIYMVIFVILVFTDYVAYITAVSIVAMFIMTFGYESSIRVKIYSIIMLFCIFVTTEVMVGSFMSTIKQSTIQELAKHPGAYVQTVLGCKIVAFLIVMIYRHMRSEQVWKLPMKRFAGLFTLPVATIFIGYIIADVIQYMDRSSVVIMVCGLTLLMVSNLVVFYQYEKQMESNVKNMHMQVRQSALETGISSLEDWILQYRTSNQVLHDNKNRMLAVKGYIQSGEIDKALSVIGVVEKSGRMNGKINIMFKGIEAVVNSKINVIEGKDVDFKPRVNIGELGRIDELELCVLIGNALDNSIEACEKISGEKYIEFDMMQKNDDIIIKVVNPISEEMEQEYNDNALKDSGNNIILNKNIPREIFKTTKEDKTVHGYGLENIKNIVEKYDGALECRVEKGQFVLIANVMIYS